METRANFILVGIFALAGMVGLVAFVLWFANVEVQRQFAYLDLRFGSVAGLSRAAEVRFAGLPVGQVVDVRLAPPKAGDDGGAVLVRVEIAGETPVRADSIATIETLGLTGVSFVAISAGTPGAPPVDLSDGPVSIATDRSALQTLTEDAPAIVTGLVSLMNEMNALFSTENRSRVSTILINLERASADLGQALDDFAVVTSTVATASTDIAGFTIQLDPVVTGLRDTMDVLDRTLTAIETLSLRAGTSLEQADRALASGTRTFDAASVLLGTDLPPLLAELSQTARSLRADVSRVSADASAAMASIDQGGTALNDRFVEMEATIEAADALIERISTSLDTIDRASVAVETLASGEATALVVDARAVLSRADGAIATIARVAEVAESDLPGMLGRVRGAIDSAEGMMARIGTQVQASGAGLDALMSEASTALADVRSTFAEANVTLSAINSALELGEETLGAATRAFDSADQVIVRDVAPIAADLRQALTRLDRALAVVSEDLPGITGDLRSAAASASATFAEFGRVVQQAGGPLVAFSERALPDYAELGRESRALILNLDRLIRAIERDPGRFIFSPDPPEYRR